MESYSSNGDMYDVGSKFDMSAMDVLGAWSGWPKGRLLL